jgi:hypothetical protein
MRLIPKLTDIEDRLYPLGIFSYNEFEISKKVEDILNNEGLGGTLYLISKQSPLFINSNWNAIQNRILDNEGSLKFAFYDKPRLPKTLLKNPENLERIEMYRLNAIPKRNFALIYNVHNIKFKSEKFYLNENPSGMLLEEYKSFFENAKDNLLRINVSDCI